MYSCAYYCPLHIPDLPQSCGLLDFVETLVKQSDVFRKMLKIEFNRSSLFVPPGEWDPRSLLDPRDRPEHGDCGKHFVALSK